jgi:hypothetical protein
MGSGRFNVNSIRQTGVHDDFSEHSFRRWRPADIAHADKQYGYLFFIFNHLRNFFLPLICQCWMR